MCRWLHQRARKKNRLKKTIFCTRFTTLFDYAYRDTANSIYSEICQAKEKCFFCQQAISTTDVNENGQFFFNFCSIFFRIWKTWYVFHQYIYAFNVSLSLFLSMIRGYTIVKSTYSIYACICCQFQFPLMISLRNWKNI